MHTRKPREHVVKLIFVLGFVLGLAVPWPSAGADDMVRLVPRWKDEKLHFEIVKARQRSQDGRVTLRGTTRTDLHIEVIKASESGYSVAWTQGETKFDDRAQASNPLARRLGNLLAGYRIILALNPKGSIEAVQNWEELRKKSVAILDALTKELKTAGMDAAAVAKVRAEIGTMFSTREQIERMCTQEAQLFFLVLGRDYVRAEPIRYADRLPNPFGGEPFPSRAQFTLKKIDRGLGRAEISWTQTVAPEDSRRIMETTLKDMAERLGKPIPHGTLPKVVTIEDAADFSVEISSGWLHGLSYKRVTTAGASSQEDTLTIIRRDR